MCRIEYYVLEIILLHLLMNTKKGIIDEIENFKQNQIAIIYSNKKNKDKVNIKALTSINIGVFQSGLMTYFSRILSHSDCLILIEQTNLDIRVWHLLTERISLLLKINWNDKSNSKDMKGLNQTIIFDLIMEDLRSIYHFYKNVYLMLCDKLFSDKCIATIHFFLGEVKKMKIILAKKFNVVNETALNKDAQDALKFYQFSLNKYPLNTRTYFNIGLIHRECFRDITTSSYWFVRSLAAPNSDMKSLRDNLEKDFNIIRQMYYEKSYIIDSNTSYLDSDLEHFPLLFHRLMGILYMNIDTDKLEELSESSYLILEKILRNFGQLSKDSKNEIDNKLIAEQLSLMCIFNFHYSLNSLEDYLKINENIIIDKSDGGNTTNNKISSSSTINFNLYNHKIMSANSVSNLGSDTQTQQPKYGFKFVCAIIKNVIKILAQGYNKDNKEFVEKVLLVFFYWLSINYDVFLLITNKDQEFAESLEFMHFKISKSLEAELEKDQTINLINQYIIPVEISLQAFRPLTRFFELSNKKTILKMDNANQPLMTRLILVHFLKIFGVEKTSRQGFDDKYEIRENQIVTTTVIKSREELANESANLGTINNSKIVHTLNFKKTKPLILVDLSNVGLRHSQEGDSKIISTKKIKSCFAFFMENGHEVSGFLPEYHFKKDDNYKSKQSSNRLVPDDYDYLAEIHKKGMVIQTPSQDYDDSYNIKYGKTKDAFFVTNDLYRDYIEKISDPKQREQERRWIVSKRISFAFKMDEFIPGPDSEFFTKFNFNHLEYSQKYNNWLSKNS